MNSAPSQRVRAVTSHSLEYMQRWRMRPLTSSELLVEQTTNAVMLVAAGRGPARVPTCEHTLRYAPSHTQQKVRFLHDRQYWGASFFDYPHAPSGPEGASYFYPVVTRTLSLFGPGELRALCLGHADVFRVIQKMLNAPTSHMPQVLDSLHAVELGELGRSPAREYERHAAAIIERFAASVTELTGPLPANLLCESGSAGRPPVLARCTRLEVLTCANNYKPAVWLGLSQLHTLRNVSLRVVSTAAIAAALPRLHTLTAYLHLGIPGRANDDFASAAVAGFFADLLPRLRVFAFSGTWPAEADNGEVLPLPLPRLEQLVWDASALQPAVLRRFLDARPIRLRAHYKLIAEWMPDCDPRSGLLARVCELCVLQGLEARDRTSTDLSGIARVLRAAPQLRTFHAAPLLRDDVSWLTASDLPLGPAFENVFHPRLRHLSVRVSRPHELSCDDSCAARLRQTCFPRLRSLEVNEEPFFATPAGG